MSLPKRCCLALVLIGLAWGMAGPCHGQANPFWPPTASFSQTHGVYDRSGNLRGVYALIRLDNGDAWWFALPRQFLDLPVGMQINYMNARYGLGWDAPHVKLVLDRIRQQRMATDLRTLLQSLNRMNRQNLDLIQRLNQQQVGRPVPSAPPPAPPPRPPDPPRR